MTTAWHGPCSTRPLRPLRTSAHFGPGGELYPFPGGDMTLSDVLKLIKEKQAKFADLRFKIGRASCRERGVDLGGRRIIKKKKKKKYAWKHGLVTDHLSKHVWNYE